MPPKRTAPPPEGPPPGPSRRPSEDPDRTPSPDDNRAPSPLADLARRQDFLEDSMHEILAGLAELRKGKRHASRSPDPESDSQHETRRRRNNAGESHTAPSTFPSVTARFAHMDAKHLDAALAGTLAPELLPRLISPSSNFYKDVGDDAAVSLVADGSELFKAVRQKRAESDVIKRFTTAIPSFATFTVAWSGLTALMAHGLGNAEEGLRLSLAMNEYAEYLGDCSSTNTWESVCRYHFRFSTARFAEGASSASIWVNYADVKLMHLLQAKLAPVAKAKAQPQARSKAKAADSPTGRGKQKAPQAPKSSTCCLRWNWGGECPSPCKYGRKHTCVVCGGDHKGSTCPKST
ncbi:hypothetical protein CspHIS471_0507060 [Cutaneotrichosporon sp. HIS471]|nr:hypothetical protein CspHIS471_0507060 [Cutaneotrichosporon sp. HIS471]